MSNQPKVIVYKDKRLTIEHEGQYRVTFNGVWLGTFGIEPTESFVQQLFDEWERREKEREQQQQRDSQGISR